MLQMNLGTGTAKDSSQLKAEKRHNRLERTRFDSCSTDEMRWGVGGDELNGTGWGRPDMYICDGDG